MFLVRSQYCSKAGTFIFGQKSFTSQCRILIECDLPEMTYCCKFSLLGKKSYMAQKDRANAMFLNYPSRIHYTRADPDCLPRSKEQRKQRLTL